jgi:AcrR family transcriptional regulator
MAGHRRLEGVALFAHPLADALLAVVHERGYAAAGVQEILARAGISRAEFDRHFAGKDDIALRVFEAMIDDYVGRVERAFAAAPPWPANLRAAAYETARWILAHPDGTWFGMVGVLEAGEMALVRREEVFRWAASLIDRGRELAPEPEAVPRAAPLIAIGAIADSLRRQQQDGLEVGVIEAVPRLMYASVRPYLGEAAARRELAIPPPGDLGP